MQIKATDVAIRELGRLSAEKRKRVLASIRDDLVKFVDTSPLMELKELDTQVRVFTIEPFDTHILYRTEDVDHDNEAEVVILTLVDRDQLAHFGSGGSGKLASLGLLKDLPRSARIGHEVLANLNRVS